MKKIVLVCGLIAGFIVGAVMIITLQVYYAKGNFEHSMWLGYATMLIAFSMIFVGIKNYLHKYNDGLITFGKAFTIGLYITLIASTIYVGVWLVEYYFFVPDFMDNYADHIMEVTRASGATAAEIQKQAADMASYKEMYKNPLYVILLTYAEILPVGLIVALFSALLLKRKVNRAASMV